MNKNDMMKQCKTDILEVENIIKENNCDFEKLRNLFNIIYIDDELFDFSYGNYCEFTFYKNDDTCHKKGLAETVSIWDDDGGCEDMDISQIKIYNKGVNNESI